MIISFLFFINISYSANLWTDNIDPASFFNKKYLSIVFAGHNIKTPISMFGHTYLISHNEINPEPDAIVVEYLGDIESTPLWMINSMFYSIKGRYRLSYFMFKQREYELEDRDLWLYLLNKDALDLDRSKTKLLEGLNKPPRYNFFIKNCSYYIFDLLVAKKNILPFYTVPIETVIELKNKKLILSTKYRPSSLRVSEDAAKNVTAKEKTDVKTVLRGWDSKTVNSKNDNGFKKLMGSTLNYKIFREENPDIKNHLANEKKNYPNLADEEMNKKDPTNNSKISYLQVETAFKPIILTYRPLYSDFFSSSTDDFKYSTLELAKISTAFIDKSIKVNELSIFKLESFISAGFLTNSFVRYLDFSYYNWSIFHDAKDDLAIRFGMGYAYDLFTNTQLTLLPYLGLSFYDISNKYNTTATMAARVFLQSIFENNMKLKLMYQYDLKKHLGFKNLVQFSFVPYQNDTFSIFTTQEWLDTKNMQLVSKLGITLFL